MKITNALKSFIEADTHEAVKIGDLEKNPEAIKVVKPKFNQEIFPNAIIREALGDLTLRVGEAGTLPVWETDDRSHSLWTTTARGLSRHLQPCRAGEVGKSVFARTGKSKQTELVRGDTSSWTFLPLLSLPLLLTPLPPLSPQHSTHAVGVTLCATDGPPPPPNPRDQWSLGKRARRVRETMPNKPMQASK